MSSSSPQAKATWSRCFSLEFLPGTNRQGVNKEHAVGGWIAEAPARSKMPATSGEHGVVAWLCLLPPAGRVLGPPPLPRHRSYTSYVICALATPCLVPLPEFQIHFSHCLPAGCTGTSNGHLALVSPKPSVRTFSPTLPNTHTGGRPSRSPRPKTLEPFLMLRSPVRLVLLTALLYLQSKSRSRLLSHQPPPVPSVDEGFLATPV